MFRNDYSILLNKKLFNKTILFAKKKKKKWYIVVSTGSTKLSSSIYRHLDKALMFSSLNHIYQCGQYGSYSRVTHTHTHFHFIFHTCSAHQFTRHYWFILLAFKCTILSSNFIKQFFSPLSFSLKKIIKMFIINKNNENYECMQFS